MAKRNFDFHDSSPEQKMVYAVLYTYFEDVDQISRAGNRKYKAKYTMYRVDRPQMTLNQLVTLALDQHTQTLCDLVHIDYDFFLYKLKDYIWKVLGVRI